ncbi:heterokaryon incompatibility protein [Stagonosporopsis vannaccii]|nr:heterokaryon incompatibility protein [Stagonosporopsis vannaccii]
MATAAYQYDTLPPNKWFRLLCIHPGQHDSPLRCDLISTDLDAAPCYTALSYVWGDPNNIGHVTCSGIETTVTLSLLGGLRQLQDSERDTLVWADAICINQSDTKEKSSQVNMMGKIYDRATEVFVWLGNDPELMARHAFDALPPVNAAVVCGTHRTWYESDFDFKISQNEDANLPRGRISRDNTGALLNQRQLEAIKTMYKLPWFTRVWVLQEVGLASKATAGWGDHRIDFSEIAMFVWFAMNEPDLERRVGEETRAVIAGCPYNAVYGVWSTYGKANSWIQASRPLKVWAEHLASQTTIDFVLVLEASRAFSATDARDHVFAFLGHPCASMPGTGKPLVEADYELELEHLYCLVAKRFAEMSLNFLVQAQSTAEDLALQNGFISWVPRWDSSIKEASNAFWEAWDASLRISKQLSYPVHVSGNRLNTSAIIFDAVKYQTNIFGAIDFDPDTKNIGYRIEECWNLTERAAETVPHKYPNKQALALACILQCSYIPKNQDVAAHFRQMVGDFLQACIYWNNKFYMEKLLPLRLDYQWGVLQHRSFAARFEHYANQRRFFVTKGGYWGLGPAVMQEGDVCAVLLGADVPFVLRPTAEKGTFKLVGQAYIDGVMYGELLQISVSEGRIGAEEVCIV